MTTPSNDNSIPHAETATDWFTDYLCASIFSVTVK
jgi:hypothetical protein